MQIQSPAIQIKDFLEFNANARPNSAALISGKTILTFAELDQLTSRICSSLLSRGLTRYARVAVYLEKSAEMVAALIAVWMAGGIAVPINPKLKPTQVTYILKDSGASLFVTTPYRLSQFSTSLAEIDLKTIIVGDMKYLPDEYPGHVLSWSEIVADSSESLRRGHVIDKDPAAIMYTSGSTGMPKGVTLSHRNLVAGAESVNGYLNTDSSDTILALLPLSFDAGLSQITTGLHAGAKVVLHNHILAQDVADICERERVTSLTGVPPLWFQLASANWAHEARGCLRLFANTGGHMSRPLLAKLRDLFPRAKPFLMYGLTESFRSTYLAPDDVDRKPNSIGKAIPNAEIMVLRPDGTECAANEPGELVHRGVHVSMGYWNDSERTSKRFRPFPQQQPACLATELVVWSGDIVHRDEEGFIYFISRGDEMIKCSGYRVSPGEVESVLLDSVDIEEASVFGVADEALGQRIVAFVVARDVPNESAVRELCGQELASYMVPELIWVNELPRTPNGKIDKTSLPHLYAEHKAKECAV
jgi:acyl-CoA ligase (AMP-forming) (exosortase A-associated)